MAEIYYDKDADLSLLKGKTIGVIGFGSQGHAHALNLKDSGMNVIVGLYPGSKSWAKAEEGGLDAFDVDLALGLVRGEHHDDLRLPCHFFDGAHAKAGV